MLVLGEGERGLCVWGVLHGGLIAEHHLQFLAVEFAPVGEVHDALPVVGELLDVHLLQGMGAEGVGIPFLPGEYPQAEITLPPAPVQLPMRMQGERPDQPLLVPMEHGHGKMLLGEGRRNWGALGVAPKLCPHLLSYSSRIDLSKVHPAHSHQ